MTRMMPRMGSARTGRGDRAAGIPCIISGGETARPLVRHPLMANDHDENWLQALIHEHPALLPVSDIEPGFGSLIPVAREMVCAHGSIDNLYITPAGEIILVEAKLWRNPEARRKVVAQTLDYVAALMAMSYTDLEAAVMKANGSGAVGLYAHVADHPDALTEADFVDAVSANLRRGRFLALVVGDGIREETEALADLLQSHAGAHFTFALVEIALWRDQDDRIIALPSVLARTVMIERGIVVIDERGIPAIKPITQQPAQRAQSLSEEMFFTALAQRNPELPAALKSFLARMEPIGVYADLRSSLSLKVNLPDQAKPLNLGMIQKNGQLWTSYVHNGAPADAAMAYQQALASMIGGAVSTKAEPYVTNGTTAPQLSDLLPRHAEAWEAAIRILIAAARDEETAM